MEDCLSSLLAELKNTDYLSIISLVIDESCDRTDLKQLSVFVCFVFAGGVV